MTSPEHKDDQRKQPKPLLITQIALVLIGAMGGTTLSLVFAPKNGLMASIAFLIGAAVTAVANYLTERDKD